MARTEDMNISMLLRGPLSGGAFRLRGRDGVFTPEGQRAVYIFPQVPTWLVDRDSFSACSASFSG